MKFLVSMWTYVHVLFTKKPTVTSINTTKENTTTMNNRTVLFLRPRRASLTRRRTQIQIPVALFNSTFFTGVYGVTSESGDYHKLVFAHARGRLNTIKLEVPEIERMIDPVLKLTRNNDGTVTYEAIDGLTSRGQDITRTLLYGARVQKSKTRRAHPTLWVQQVA